MTQQRDDNELVNEQSSTIRRRGSDGWYVEAAEEELAGPFDRRDDAVDWLTVTLMGWTRAAENSYRHPDLGVVQLDEGGRFWEVLTPAGKVITTTPSALSGVVYLQGLNATVKLVRRVGSNASILGLAGIVAAPTVGGLQPEQCPPFALLIFLLFAAMRDPRQKSDNPVVWMAFGVCALLMSLAMLACANWIYADMPPSAFDLESGRALAVGGAIAFLIGRLLERAGRDFLKVDTSAQAGTQR